jgi:hypothetical protein
MFAPEKGQGESEALEASVDIATRGRKRGICLVGMTQRLAMLHKSATSQLQNRLVGAQFEEVNVKVAAKLFGIAPGGEEREFRQQIQLLEPGQFFAFGRAISRERVLIQVRSVETSHPKAFEKHSAPPPPTPEKIKGLLPQLADLPKEAEDKAKTEAEFKRQIRDLTADLQKARRMVSTANTAAPVQSQESGQALRDAKQMAQTSARAIQQLKIVMEESMRILTKITLKGFDEPIKTEEMEAALKKAAQEIGRIAAAKIQAKQMEFDSLKKECDRLMRRMKALLDGDQNVTVGVSVTKNEPVSVRPTIEPKAAVRPIRPIREITPEQLAAAADGLKPTHLRVLNNLAELLAITGADSASKEQLAAWSKYSPQGGGYGNILGLLRTAGMIDYGGNGVLLTKAGREFAQPSDISVTNSEMLARAKSVLKPAEAKILDEIAAAYPEPISKEDLAGRTGYAASGGGFGNYLGHMRTLGFITYETGGCRCADWLFVEKGVAASA